MFHETTSDSPILIWLSLCRRAVNQDILVGIYISRAPARIAPLIVHPVPPVPISLARNSCAKLALRDNTAGYLGFVYSLRDTAPRSWRGSLCVIGNANKRHQEGFCQGAASLERSRDGGGRMVMAMTAEAARQWQP